MSNYSCHWSHDANHGRALLNTMLLKRADDGLASLVVHVFSHWLEDHGYDTRRFEPTQLGNKRAFYAAEQAAKEQYAALDPQLKLALPAMLESKYKRKAVVGKVRVYDVLARLATVINPLEPELGCVSQLTHMLQLASAMEEDGLDERLVLSGLIHDVGTILLATDEDPVNVEAGGKKSPLTGTHGGGLYNCTFRWDHGDFVYLRLKDYVSPDIAWLLRHHSMDLETCAPYMNDQDREYTAQLFLPFTHYDERKDRYRLPKKRLEDYRALLDRAFPTEILI
jgi:hypothetical protein